MVGDAYEAYDMPWTDTFATLPFVGDVAVHPRIELDGGVSIEGTPFSLQLFEFENSVVLDFEVEQRFVAVLQNHEQRMDVGSVSPYGEITVDYSIAIQQVTVLENMYQELRYLWNGQEFHRERGRDILPK